MRMFTEDMLARHTKGGLVCFANAHSDVAEKYFPSECWPSLIKRINRALWCAIAGQMSLRKPLDKKMLVRHGSGAFLAFASDFPKISKDLFPGQWRYSIMKRIIGNLWSDLHKSDLVLPDHLDVNDLCEPCKMAVLQKREAA